MNVRVLIRNDKSLLVDRPVAFSLDVKYKSLDLTLIRCIEISASAYLES